MNAKHLFKTAVVAEFAEILRHSYWAQDNSLPALAGEAQRVANLLSNDLDVQEFANLVWTATGLSQ